ncbi:MAG: hypothetical protein ACE5WD_02075 [Candidatus Aminicenantia bacterium]
MLNVSERGIQYEFVEYGKEFEPEENVLVLDVGLKTLPGVIDHHHPQAEPECTASLIVKYPRLVTDHLRETFFSDENQALKIITHRLPDFDAVASIFLAIKLIELREIDSYMKKIAHYTKMADSATIPKEIDLSYTPYSILRSLFNDISRKYKSKGSTSKAHLRGEEIVNLERVKEGLKFINFLYLRAKEGYEIIENRLLFSGVYRYEQAMRKVSDDYFNYLADIQSNQKIILSLPLTSGTPSTRGSSRGFTPRGKKVDGLIVRNPKSFLLKEWAKRDFRNTKFKKGFSFLLTNFWNKRYILGVDPECGVNLKGLGDLLNQKEEQRRKELEKSFSSKWYDGNCPFFNFRIIDSPKQGTALTHQEVVQTVLDFSRQFE